MMKPGSCEGCPLYDTGQGFVLDSGDPTTASMILALEAPGGDEIEFRIDHQTDNKPYWDAELAIRRRDYPDMEDRFIRQGAPVVGKSGHMLWGNILKPVGIHREQVFTMNVLRCKPPKTGDLNYPTGETRKQAGRFCRQYDRQSQFKPDTGVVAMHPAAIVRDVTPLPMVIEAAVRKARDYALYDKRKVMLMFGGKPTRAFTGGRENVTYWQGDTVVPFDGTLVE